MYLQATKLDKYTSKTTSITPTFNNELNKESTTKPLESTSLKEIPTLTTTNTSILQKPLDSSATSLNSTTISEIYPSSTTKDTVSATLGTSSYEIHVNSTPTIKGNVTHIESSIKDVLQTMKEELPMDISTLSSTATEKLPETNLLKTSLSTSMTNTVKSTTTTISEYFT